MADAVDIDAARGNVGRDQHPALAAAEPLERAGPGGLRLVAVDGIRRHAMPAQLLGHAVGAMLGLGEHQDAVDRRVLEQLQQQRPLVRLLDEHHPLLDPLRGRGDGMHGHLGGIGQDLIGERHDLARHGGREEQGLTLLWQHPDYPAHVMDEAHVEHAVGLVQDEHLKGVEPDVALIEQVEQPARRRDQDVDAARQCLDLRHLPDAAEHDGLAQARMAAIGGEAGADLGRELAGRGEDQDPAGLGAGAPRHGRETLQDRQHEGCGLAGAGLGAADQIAALQDDRDRRHLDRGRRFILLVADGAQQRLDQLEISKTCQGIRYFRKAA